MTEPDGWRRLHPLTPVLSGGRFALVAVAVVVQQGFQQDTGRLLLAALAVAPVAAALAWVSWRAMRYRLTDTELQVDSGVLTRRQRRVPLQRLQSVDVVRPLLARVLGLAELRLEVAGGGSTEAPLSYLSEADAGRLRALLLQRASGAGPDPAAEAPELPLVSVPTGPLVASVLLGAPVWAAVALLLALVVALAVGGPDAAGLLVVSVVPVVLAVGAAGVRRLLVEYGFTVAESADGLRLRHGLLETRSATIPRDRVQSVRLREPVLWRPFGWARLEVDVAGYAPGGGEQQLATSALLPVAPRAFAVALAARVLGGPLPAPVAPAPARARWRAPLSAPLLRVGLDDVHLVSRTGLLVPTTDVVPLAKVQSLRVSRGPWQRRLGLATLRADTAGRRLPGAVLPPRDGGEADALLVELAARARQQRAARR